MTRKPQSSVKRLLAEYERVKATQHTMPPVKAVKQMLATMRKLRNAIDSPEMLRHWHD